MLRHEGLWNVMIQFNIEERVVCLIESLYKNAQRAVDVIIIGATSKFFKKTVGVRQGCSLSPTLFNIYLEEIIGSR